MKGRTFASWILLLLLSLLPLLPWYLFGPHYDFSYANLTHALGQMAALIGMTMFALTFILSMRLRFIEDMFGGLDKVYVVHGVLGGTALILLLFHPIFLVLKFVPENVKLAASYLLPSGYWSVNFGIIALLGLIVLIAVTLYMKVKYQKWKLSHKFMGLFFIFAVFHIFLVRTQAARDYIFSGYYVYAAIVSLIGLIGFFYTLLLKDKMAKNALYVVNAITTKNNAIYDLTLTPKDKPLEYRSGQFVFLRFYNKRLNREAHPFSIASASNNPNMRIVIKNLGDFTSGLGEVKVGDTVSVEGPYGRFHYRKTGADQIWIAGGIGVTPFIGMAEDLVTLNDAKKHSGKVDMYYSVKSRDDLIAADLFLEVQKRNNSFAFFPWLSNEKGRLSADVMASKSGRLRDKDFYLCGPKEFKESLSRQLIAGGVSKDKIYQEEFNFK